MIVFVRSLPCQFQPAVAMPQCGVQLAGLAPGDRQAKYTCGRYGRGPRPDRYHRPGACLTNPVGRRRRKRRPLFARRALAFQLRGRGSAARCRRHGRQSRLLRLVLSLMNRWPGSSGPSGPAPCPRPGKRRPVPGQPGPPQAARPGRRCPGRLDGELRGLFVRGLGDGADVVAHPGGKRGGQRCARDVTPRDEARRLPVRAGVRSRRHRDHQDPSRAHLGRAPSASVSPEFCAASCSTVTLPASLVDKGTAAAASVLRSVCR